MREARSVERRDPRHMKAIHWTLLVMVVALAATLRFWDLGYKNLWVDEYPFVDMITSPTLAETSAAPHFPHSPLFPMLMRPFAALLANDTTARLIPALLGAASVPLLFLLGRAMLGVRVGLFAAAALAMCPQHVSHSRKLENYALAVLLVILAAWALWSAFHAGKPLYWIGAGAAVALAIYGSVFSAIALGGMTIAALCDSTVESRIHRRLVAAVAVWMTAGLFYLPFAVVGFFSGEHVAGLGQPGLFAAFFTNGPFSAQSLLRVTLSIWREESQGGAAITFPLLTAAAVVFAGFLMSFAWKPRIPLVTVLLWALSPVVIFGIAYLADYPPHGRYFLTAVPGICLAIGTCLDTCLSADHVPPWGRWPLRAIVAATAIPLSAWSLSSVFSQFVLPPQEDYKQTFRWLEQVSEPGDRVVCALYSARSVLDRYAPSMRSRCQRVRPGQFTEDIESALRAGERVWYVHYNEWFPVGAERKAWLEENGIAAVTVNVRGTNTCAMLLWPAPPGGEPDVAASEGQLLQEALPYAGPNGHRALMRLGQLAAGRGDGEQASHRYFQAAAEHLKKLVFFAPYAPYLRFEYADCLQHAGRFELAEREYRRARALFHDRAMRAGIDQRIAQCRAAAKTF